MLEWLRALVIAAQGCAEQHGKRGLTDHGAPRFFGVLFLGELNKLDVVSGARCRLTLTAAQPQIALNPKFAESTIKQGRRV